jgi:ATP-binding cassette, subfamily B, bacterial PglK
MYKLLKRLWNVITLKRKRQLVIVVLLMLLASAAEVFSIGAVMPFLAVIAKPQVVYEHEYAQFFVNYLGLTEPNQLIFPLMVLFALAALIAGLMRILLLWSQTRISHAIGVDIGYKIYKITLYQPYSKHVLTNSSEVISGISIKVTQVIGNIVLPVLTIISSFVMVTIILVILILINPIVTSFTIISLVIIYLLISLLTKKTLVNNSKLISKKTDLIFKVLQEGLGGIRDILIDGTQSIYYKAFRNADVPRRRAIANNQIIGQSPRYVIESFAMILMALVTYYLSSDEGTLIGVFPFLGALAIGAQRMLPLVQQAYVSWSKIYGSKAILSDTMILLEQPYPKNLKVDLKQSINFKNSISLREISFKYSNDTPWIVNNFSIDILAGTSIGFIGSTGSGKSTLMDLIMTLLTPSKGKILIDNVEITSENYRNWQANIAHIPQTIFLNDATILENIAFGVPIEKIDKALVRKVAKQAQIHATIESWDQNYNTMVGERGVRISGGQRQRIGIARALYKQVDVMIMDEATSALDNETERVIMESLFKEYSNITILMVAHRLSSLKNCDQIIEIDSGLIKRQFKPGKY